MDTFAVVDAFIHEMTMMVDDGMPRSYLNKQCREKLNINVCAVKPTPGLEPGAQLSFRDVLISNLKLMVSNKC